LGNGSGNCNGRTAAAHARHRDPSDLHPTQYWNPKLQNLKVNIHDSINQTNQFFDRASNPHPAVN
jgi:hypothetical protein